MKAIITFKGNIDGMTPEEITSLSNAAALHAAVSGCPFVQVRPDLWAMVHVWYRDDPPPSAQAVHEVSAETAGAISDTFRKSGLSTAERRSKPVDGDKYRFKSGDRARSKASRKLARRRGVSVSLGDDEIYHEFTLALPDDMVTTIITREEAYRDSLFDIFRWPRSGPEYGAWKRSEALPKPPADPKFERQIARHRAHKLLEEARSFAGLPRDFVGGANE